jgi:hypothetical protein
MKRQRPFLLQGAAVKVQGARCINRISQIWQKQLERETPRIFPQICLWDTWVEALTNNGEDVGAEDDEWVVRHSKHGRNGVDLHKHVNYGTEHNQSRAVLLPSYIVRPREAFLSICSHLCSRMQKRCPLTRPKRLRT